MTKKMNMNNINNIKDEPVAIVYPNAELMKNDIIKENRKKSGVYMWTNILNGKNYIGSSVNLGIRFKDYFNKNKIANIKKSTSAIHKALIKYGYSNFKLTIIVFCEPERILETEQMYIDKIKPEYNILKFVGTSKGYKHSKETLEKMRIMWNIVNKKKRYPVEIFDTQTETKLRYDSIVLAGKALNTNEKNIRYAFQHKKLLLKRYIVNIVKPS